MLFTVLLELELPSTTPPLAPPPSLSIQFLFHVSDVVQTKNLKQLKVGQNAPQNLVKISGHPPNIHAFATSLLALHANHYSNAPTLLFRCLTPDNFTHQMES